MARKKKNENIETFNGQINFFLEEFKKQAPYVRDELAKTIPAYNALLNMNGKTFEELALLPLAEARGLPYANPLFSFDSVLPVCPFCKEEKRIYKVKANSYTCRNCARKFAANYNSISSDTNCDSVTWMKVFRCMVNFYGVKKTCEYCNIAPNTYYQIRNRIFYGLQILVKDVRLYGNIESDITFSHVSYKGMSLVDYDYPEDSPFYDEVFIPRERRDRGGPHNMKESNANLNAIFTAIDDRGHVLCRFIGIGKASLRTLKSAIEEDKFLLTVPNKDPFPFFKYSDPPKSTSVSGDHSLFICDKERSVELFASRLGLPVESHVYRRNGHQMKLPKDSHNIQRVNALHRRLKDFLRNTNHVSSKYLPGFLLLFEFLENTGASDQAVAALFRILSKPHLGHPSAFYDDLFVVPNYLIEWLEDSNSLGKLPYNKILGFYYYDKFKSANSVPGVQSKLMKLSEIEEATGYSAPTLRRNYKNLCSAGYRNLILAYFEKPKRKESNPSALKKQSIISHKKTVPTVLLSMYDDYAKNRLLFPHERLTLKEFVPYCNEKYDTKYTYSQILHAFEDIPKLGLRPPLPPLSKRDSNYIKPETLERYAALYEEYLKLEQNYKSQNKHFRYSDIHNELADKFNYSISTVIAILTDYRKYLKSK